MRKKIIECLSCVKHCSRLWKYKNENQNNNNKNLTYFRDEGEPINKNKVVRKAMKKEMQEEN